MGRKKITEEKFIQDWCDQAVNSLLSDAQRTAELIKGHGRTVAGFFYVYVCHDNIAYSDDLLSLGMGYGRGKTKYKEHGQKNLFPWQRKALRDYIASQIRERIKEATDGCLHLKEEYSHGSKYTYVSTYRIGYYSEGLEFDHLIPNIEKYRCRDQLKDIMNNV